MSASDHLRNLHAVGLDDVSARFLVERSLPLIADAIAAAEAELPTCGEWLDHPERGPHRCGQPADLILWGKLFDPEALGPRCMNHATQHHPELDRHHTTIQSAVVDLRPRRRALAALDDALKDTP